MKKLKFRKLHVLILLFVIIAIFLGIDYFRISSVKPFLQKPAEKIKTEQNQIYLQLVNGEKNIDWHRLDGTLEFVNGQYDTSNRSMMMQWGMEAFTNPEVIRNSLYLIRKDKMFTNAFLTDFKTLDFTILRLLHLEPLLVKFINPQSNGAAIQKGNTYTYKTKDYSLYSVQNYHPGTYGDQQHVAGMNIENFFSIFHTHPAVEKESKMHSPNYWVGYGHLPDVAQDKNVSLAIYHIPAKKGLLEVALLDYTHAYFPKTEFDTTVVKGNYAMGKKGNTYCAFIGRNPFEFRENTTDDLIQQGKQTFWITEAGSKDEDGSFADFCQRVQNNRIDFNPETLTLNYQSGGKNYQLAYNGDFDLDGKTVNNNYMRYDSPYCQAERKADAITFNFNGKSLHLDFNKMIREF